MQVLRKQRMSTVVDISVLRANSISAGLFLGKFDYFESNVQGWNRHFSND